MNLIQPEKNTIYIPVYYEVFLHALCQNTGERYFGAFDLMYFLQVVEKNVNTYLKKTNENAKIKLLLTLPRADKCHGCLLMEQLLTYYKENDKRRPEDKEPFSPTILEKPKEDVSGFALKKEYIPEYAKIYNTLENHLYFDTNYPIFGSDWNFFSATECKKIAQSVTKKVFCANHCLKNKKFAFTVLKRFENLIGDALTSPKTIKYEEYPNFPKNTVSQPVNIYGTGDESLSKAIHQSIGEIQQILANSKYSYISNLSLPEEYKDRTSTDIEACLRAHYYKDPSTFSIHREFTRDENLKKGAQEYANFYCSIHGLPLPPIFDPPTDEEFEADLKKHFE